MKIVKSLEGLITKIISKTIKNEAKEQKCCWENQLIVYQ